MDYFYDPEVDIHYFELSKNKISKTTVTSANVDIDADGNIVGIELFGWEDERE